MSNIDESKAPLVVVYPRGQLTAEDKATMREFGIVPLEADDPKAVQQLHLSAPLVNTAINGDMIVRAALTAIAERAPATNTNTINAVGLAAHHFVRMLAASLAEQPK